MERQIIQHGAEAVIYLEEDEEHGKVLVKERIKKGYRLPELDSMIRKCRTRHEERLIRRAGRAGIAVPMIFDSSGDRISMEYIEGDKVKDVFNDADDKKKGEICQFIGESLGKLHSTGIVHGDFTTSNMILKRDGHRRQKSRQCRSFHERLFIIDLGLGKHSTRPEDQAADLFLLYEALKAAHFKYLNEAWQKILKSYQQEYSQARDVLTRLERIEKRRRYKGG